MPGLGGSLTGFVFDLARDILKDAVKSALGGTVRRIIEAEVNAIVLQKIQMMPRHDSHNIYIAGGINIVVKEVFALAAASHGLKVLDKTIEIEPASLDTIPESEYEMLLGKSVQNLTSKFKYLLTQDLHADIELSTSLPIAEQPLIFSTIEANPLITTNIDDNTTTDSSLVDQTTSAKPPAEEVSNQPLMFPQIEASIENTAQQHEIDDIVEKYKQRFQSIHEQEVGQ